MKQNRALPGQLADVAAQSTSINEFGQLLREWIHFVLRNDVSNRKALSRAIEQRPELLANRFPEGGIADAFLAAYAEWIADRAGVQRPGWTRDCERSLEFPWFADNARASLLILTPASFRQRNLFTVPENVVRLRRGRPRVSTEHKRTKARARDQRYRAHIRKLIHKSRAEESVPTHRNLAAGPD